MLEKTMTVAPSILVGFVAGAFVGGIVGPPRAMLLGTSVGRPCSHFLDLLAKLLLLFPHGVERAHHVVVVSMHVDGLGAAILTAIVPILARTICVELETVGGVVGVLDCWRPLRTAVAELLLAFRGWRFASLLVILSGLLGDAITRIHLGASLASLLLSLDLLGELLEQPLGTILALF